MIIKLLYLFDLTFVDEVPDRLKCLICKLILKNAQQTSCGCRMCESCLSKLLGEDERPCPGCKEDMVKLGRDIYQDRAANKEIATLEVKCPFETCVVTDQLRSVSRASLRTERDALRGLRKICEKYPNKCVTQKVLIENHSITNLNQRLECSEEKLVNEKLKEHSNEEMIPHFTKLVKEFKEIKQENQILSEEIVTLKKSLWEQTNNLEKLTESRIKIEKSVDDLKKKSSRTSLIREQNIIFRNGSFFWKITDFRKLITDAESGERESITSDPFYTSDLGYRMCLKIYPNGGGDHQGSHLSVFFAIMKGDFDDLLSWPFKQKVTVTLLDQENNGANNNYKKFKGRGCSSQMLECYQRPVDNINIAYGFPDFISLVKLFQSKYYRDNTIVLKISLKGLHKKVISIFYKILVFEVLFVIL